MYLQPMDGSSYLSYQKAELFFKILFIQNFKKKLLMFLFLN